MTYPITCSDPQHATRSGEPGWADQLGTSSVADLTGGLCPACARAAATGCDSSGLVAFKATLCGRVDLETVRRIGAGFSWGGEMISSSIVAQIGCNGLGHRAARLDYTLTPSGYPVANRTNTAVVYLTNQADADSLVDAAFDAIAPIKGNGALVKANVLAATTPEDARAAAASWLSGGAP